MSSEKPLVLITGATGALGPRVARVFSKAGYRLRTLSLGEAPQGLLPADSENHVGDITDYDSVISCMKGVDVVIHMAALLHVTSDSPSLADRYQKVNVGGTRNIVDAAERENVQRLVYYSTIAVYGDDISHVATEETRPAPYTDYAKSKLSAEGSVLAAKCQDGTAMGTVLRLAATYGSRVKGNYMRLLESLSNGRFLPLGRGENRRTLVYDRDVARFTLLAAQHPGAAGRVFNVTDGNYHTVEEIIVAMCDALGREVPRLYIPIGLGRLVVGGAGHIYGMLGRQAPFTQAALAKYTADVAVCGKLAQKELGFLPLYDLSAGWEETVQEMRSSGQLH